MTDRLHEIIYRPKLLHCKILMLSEEIEKLETHLFPSGIRYDKDTVQTSPVDNMSKTLAVVADMQKERQKLIDQYADAIVEVSTTIDKLSNIDEQRVLHAYYIGCKSWERVAEEFNYSEAWVYKVRKSAIEHLEALI